MRPPGATYVNELADGDTYMNADGVEDRHMYEKLKTILARSGAGGLPPTPVQAAASSAPTSQHTSCRRPPLWVWVLLVIGVAIVVTLVTVLLVMYHRNCQAAYEDGKTESGVYSLKHQNGDRFSVYCEMDLDKGGWTVFQNRFDGSQDFYKDWNAYEEGFGDVAGEFWLGNKNLHLLTADRNQKLKIELKFTNETAIVDYASIWVSNETEKFKLQVAGFSRAHPPGDSLLPHSNQPFSTVDQDNDVSNANCAKLYTGAWWYKACYESNLNGAYGDQANTGVVWKSWKGASTSLTGVRMMVKTVEVYRDCLAAYNHGQTKSGVYRISPDTVNEIDVYCEQELEGGGWTVFQRRMDGTVNFKQTWHTYKKGFGTVDTEYWLGNDLIHLMTVNKDQKLKVEIEHGGLTAYADYSEFWISDERSRYTLHVGGFTNGQNMPGDSLAYSNEEPFSTHNADHDQDANKNCAVIHSSAWWYESCAFADLNAAYGANEYQWHHWRHHASPLTASRMMLKTK